MSIELNKQLTKVMINIYEKLDFKVSHINYEIEGKQYDACKFEINDNKIICRSSKITPKKVGQFVTFWKRNKNGECVPFNETDPIDFYVINVKTDNHLGQFVFPRSELLKRGIISNSNKEGKRGFRVYPKWDVAENKQAQKTQEWQLVFFYEINESIDLQIVAKLYESNK